MQRTLLVALSLACGLTLLGAERQAHANASSSDRIGTSSAHWMRGICGRQPGHRITTASIDRRWDYLAEPAKGIRPRITAQHALDNFVKSWGPMSPQQRRATQVRFGLITASDSAVLDSDNALDLQPTVRRVPAWIISNCSATTRPRGYGFGHRAGDQPGRLIAVVPDTWAPQGDLAGDFEYRNARTGGSGTEWGAGRPRRSVASSRFYSVPWRLVKRSPKHPARALIEYHRRRCYSFDHITLQFGAYHHHGRLVSVILSTDPGGKCAKPSSAAPYMEVIGGNEVLGVLHHAPTGALRFKPTQQAS